MSFPVEVVAGEIQNVWRKAAMANMAAQTSKQDVEKAFLDQAYMLIQNKGTPLMKAPYRVGFEIVFKNDENNRLVGIFVFRVDTDLYYAPCFFISGTIKGTDLLYRHTEKQFVPLTTDWAEYLIAQTDGNMGVGVPMSERAFTRHQLELRDLAQPPNSQQSWRKYSSEGIQDPDIKAFWEAHKDLLKPEEEKESLLRKFAADTGGFAARMALARAAKKNPAFGKALVTHSKPENFAPELPAEKQASASLPEPVLTLYTNLLRNPGVKAASHLDLARDWQVDDFRKEAEINEEVYQDPAVYLEQVTGPGMYDMLTSDGAVGPYLAAPELPEATLRSECPMPGVPYSYGGSTERPTLVFVDLKTKESCCIPIGVRFGSRAATDHQAMGKCTGSLRDCAELQDVPEVGKAYRLVTLSPEGISEAFYVTHADTSPGGLKQIWISRWSRKEHERLPLLLNPAHQGFDVADKICGAGVKFVEVQVCSEAADSPLNFGQNVRLGGTAALNHLIFEGAYKRASIISCGELDYCVETEDAAGQTRSPLLGKLAAMAHVAARCNVRMELAETLLQRSKEASDRPYAFYFRPFTKAGYNVSFNEWPNLHATGNTEFQTLEEPVMQDLIQARRDDPYIVPHRIGDLYRHEGINGARELDDTTPMALAQQSAERGVSSLFEHGVVGELVKTYDATALVDKYLPDLLLGLDRIGRLLFLLYWKPQDFAQDYGGDDQVELENQMLSNFKQQGALVLALLQKSDALKRPDSLGSSMP